jgi:thiamine pyrophosphate-dependent acetolactate synthase large subunit-like protein
MGDIPVEGGPSVSRRRFVTGSALAGVASAVAPMAARSAHAAPVKTGALPAPDMQAETGPVDVDDVRQIARSGSDFMTDVIKTLGIKYIAANPGSSFRGLQESLINYGRNAAPEWLTCCHEESSVAMAHGYYKIAGKPMIAMVHGTVGVQHASMAIYNAYADRVPILLVSGNARDANTRRVPVEWQHSVQDNALIVRDYTKWDDQPVSLQHYAESQVRAMKLACAVPGAPVMITVDMDLQEDELTPAAEAKLSIPRLSLDLPPQGDDAALNEAAKLLVAAERPLIFADRYARTPHALELLIELAELLGAAVIDGAARMNFPSTHYLNQTGVAGTVQDADLILALEPVDLWGAIHTLDDTIAKPWRTITAPGCKVISISTADMLIKANYQDFQRYAATDLAIAGDAEASMPGLIEAVRRAGVSNSSTRADRHRTLREQHLAQADAMRKRAAAGWSLSPVHPARLAMEVWDQIKDDDWSLVGTPTATPSWWARRLWPMEKAYHHTGGTGASGVGYGLPAAIGSALANRDAERLSINFQPDGDFMYAPGVLWTAAHHRIPLLTIMHNNGGYHQEQMHLQLMANRHDRGIARTGIGTSFRDPGFDFAKIAQGMGVHAEGPISDPGQLRDAIKRALAVVRGGQPALIDVIGQPR